MPLCLTLDPPFLERWLTSWSILGGGSVGRDVQHVGPGVHALRCTHQARAWSSHERMHVTTSFGRRFSTPPSVPSVRMRDKHVTDPCVSHGLLFCWSIFVDQFHSLFSNLCKLTMPPLNLGSNYSSHFQVQFPPACIFGFWPCTSACPVSRPLAEEVSSFWKLLHTFHSECGRENKTNPVT